MWFNADTTAEGVEALRQYRTEYDERLKTFADTPHRDWTTDTLRRRPQSSRGTSRPKHHRRLICRRASRCRA